MIRRIINYLLYGRFIEDVSQTNNGLIVTTRKEFDKNELRRYFERKSRINFIAKRVTSSFQKDSTFKFYTYEFDILTDINIIDGGEDKHV